MFGNYNGHWGIISYTFMGFDCEEEEEEEE